MNDILLVTAAGGVMLTICAFVFMFLDGVARSGDVKRLTQQNQDLMNRLMARNFPEYASGTVAISPPVTRANVEDYMNQYAENGNEQDSRQSDGMSVI
jgi:hypothetical protein